MVGFRGILVSSSLVCGSGGFEWMDEKGSKGSGLYGFWMERIEVYSEMAP